MVVKLSRIKDILNGINGQENIGDNIKNVLNHIINLEALK